MKEYLKLFRHFIFLTIMLMSFSTPTAVSGVVDVENGSSGQVASGSEVLDIEDVLGEDGTTQTSHIDLTTVVPKEIEVVIIGPGTIKNGGKTYSSNSTIRTADTTFKLSPNKGYKIDSVYWNSVNITSMVVNGVLNLSGMDGGVLEVKFVKISNSHEEGGELDPSQSEGEGSEIISLEDFDDEEENRKNAQESSLYKAKLKSPKFTKTADKFEIIVYLACVWLLSLIVFTCTIVEAKFWTKINKGRRYKKIRGGNRYRRLKN